MNAIRRAFARNLYFLVAAVWVVAAIMLYSAHRGLGASVALVVAALNLGIAVRRRRMDRQR
ncbi:MAG TPA: hypothetical protein VIT92_07325 [Burkholderiaceae bacterium]